MTAGRVFRFAISRCLPATVLLVSVCVAASPAAAEFAFSAGSRVPIPVQIGWSPSEPLKFGVDLWAGGAYREALEQFRLAVRLMPTDPVAWHDFGVALYTVGEFEEALDSFGHEKFLAPGAASAWFGIGKCHLALGRPDLAENDFVMGLLSAPREWQYWQGLADAYAVQGKSREAEAALRNAERLKPRPPREFWSFARVKRSVLAPVLWERDPYFRYLHSLQIYRRPPERAVGPATVPRYASKPRQNR